MFDPFPGKLVGWLKTESGESRKEWRRVWQLRADLVGFGVISSFARMAALSRRWREDRQCEQQTVGHQTLLPLHLDPGDAFQFDLSEDFEVPGSVRIRPQIKLSLSRDILRGAYPLQSHEMLFGAHRHAFPFFGDVPARGICDSATLFAIDGVDGSLHGSV